MNFLEMANAYYHNHESFLAVATGGVMGSTMLALAMITHDQLFQFLGFLALVANAVYARKVYRKEIVVVNHGAADSAWKTRYEYLDQRRSAEQTDYRLRLESLETQILSLQARLTEEINKRVAIQTAVDSGEYDRIARFKKAEGGHSEGPHPHFPG